MEVVFFWQIGLLSNLPDSVAAHEPVHRISRQLLQRDIMAARVGALTHFTVRWDAGRMSGVGPLSTFSATR